MARELGLPKSAVSQRLSKLEDELGGRLMMRSTRHMSLTEFGSNVYRHAVEIAEQQTSLMNLAVSSGDAASGLIRITAPPDMGPYLIRSPLKRFMEAHPSIRMEVDLSTRYVDLVSEGFDLALRATVKGLDDSTLIAVKLHDTKLALFCSRQYLERSQVPKTPEDLKSHRMLAFAQGDRSEKITMKLSGGGRQSAIDFQPVLSATNYTGVYEAIRAGIGIGLIPSEICTDELAAGDVIRILPEWGSGHAQIYAVYPSRKFLTPRTKLLIQFLIDCWFEESQ